MNRIRKWLIHKLGGITKEEYNRILNMPIPIIREHLEAIPITVQVPIPDRSFRHFTDESIQAMIEINAARELGTFIINNKLFEASKVFDYVTNSDIMRFDIKVLKKVGGERNEPNRNTTRTRY